MTTEQFYQTYKTNQNDFLSHHGILGQKWGVRRFQNKDGSLTPEGRKHYGYKSLEYYGEQKRFKNADYKSRTREDWQMIDAIQKYNDTERRKIFKGQNFIANSKYFKQKVSRIFDDTDSESGYPIKRKEMSKEQDLSVINPTFNSTTVASSNNCALCTVAYDMRRRGYDVIARQNAPITLLYDISKDDIGVMYKNSKNVETGTAKNSIERMSKEPSGSRGALFMSWGTGGGHVVAYEIENGKPVIYDAQVGKKTSDILSSDYARDSTNWSFTRLDNAEPNFNIARLAVE